jgi:nitrate reductase gamma subunit
MGIFLSILGFLILAVIGFLGQYLPALFGIAVPYAAFAIFLIGVVARIVKWARSPVPFRIPTTAGQQKSLPWIKQNRLDNPSSSLGVVGRMLLEVLFFRSLFRNTKSGMKDGKKLVIGDDKWLWLFSIAFHYSFLIIVLRHFRFFTYPTPGFVDILQTLDGFMQIGVPILYLTNIGILVGLGFLFMRRITNKKVRYISIAADYFPLILIAGIAVTGVLMRYFFKTDIVAAKELAVGLLSFHPVVPVGLSGWFWMHFFLVCSLLVYFPMSKLVHMGGIFMSPTRNLANNNRAVRHENPWNPEVEFHTYKEYEEEFHDVMKAAGLPLDYDKEGKGEAHVSK